MDRTRVLTNRPDRPVGLTEAQVEQVNEQIRRHGLSVDHIPELAAATAKYLADLRRQESVGFAPVAAGVHLAGVTRLAGWSLRETAAAATTVILRHGANASGEIIAVLRLAADGSDTEALPRPIRTPHGVFVDTAGVVQGALWAD